jgi:hypothetical protein
MVGLVVCISLVATGCGGSNPKTIKVTGKVSYKGKPVTQGSITFQPAHPTEGGLSRPARGDIGSDGTYELSTFETGDGVMPGDYIVLVVTATGGPSPEEPDAKATWATPERFGSPIESPLEASVPADSRAMELNFDLDDTMESPKRKVIVPLRPT